MKRQNDNPQASKEDYERLSKMGSQVGHGFERVNPEVLKKRRIVKARHPPNRSGSSAETTSSEKKNPFASVSLVQGGSSSSSSKPNFSFGSFATSKPTTTTTTTTSSTTGGGFSFGSQPAGSTDLKTKYEKRAINMEDSFRTTLNKHGTECNWLNIFDQYMDSVVKMKFEYFTELKNKPSTNGGLTTTSTAGAISFGSFGSTNGAVAPASSTTTSGTNLFGSFASSPSSIQTTNKGPSKQSFSFGTTTTTTPNMFSVVDKTTTTTTTSNDNTTDDAAAPAEDPQQQNQLDRSDVDWDDLELIENVLLFHKRGPEKKLTKFASGPFRIQQFKSDSSKRRMIHRDIAGKVRFNVQIYKGMNFGGSVYKKKNGSHRERVIFMGMMDQEHGREMFEIHRAQVPGSSLLDILKKAADF